MEGTVQTEALQGAADDRASTGMGKQPKAAEESAPVDGEIPTSDRPPFPPWVPRAFAWLRGLYRTLGTVFLVGGLVGGALLLWASARLSPPPSE